MHLRLLVPLIISISVLFCMPVVVHAADFFTDAEVRYDVEESGQTKVIYDLQIENASENSLSKGYILSLTHITPREISTVEDNEDVFPEIVANDNGTNIILHFLKPVNGKEKKKKLKISFTADTIAHKSGDIWEVFIPKIAHKNDFRVYDVTLSVPNEFGEEGYMVPISKHMNEEENRRIYHFDRNDLEASGINAAYGKFQVFSFTLTYHLSNSSFFRSTKEIAIPPDTSIQKVYLDRIEPKPKTIRIDTDGNWIAEYVLSPFSRKDIEVKGQAQIFISPRKFVTPGGLSLFENTKNTRYWQKDDTEISELGKKLATPEAIYNYVIATLTYDYERATPDVVRRGAVDALKNRESAICTEFTDLFIALMRAANIPTRELNGFAYSDNPQIQPLSLVADVLHSWPEYWDEKREVWVPVDPTWGKTTGGQDFFNKFDLKHVAFVVHGTSDTKPVPAGSYKLDSEPEKDVYVALSTLEEAKTGNLEITYTNNSWIPIVKKMWNVVLTNEGSTALYDQNVEIYFDDTLYKSVSISALPPRGKTSFTVESPVGILAKDVPKSIVIQTLSGKVILPSNKSKTVMLQIILSALGLLCIGVLSSLLFGGRRVQYLYDKARKHKSRKNSF